MGIAAIVSLGQSGTPYLSQSAQSLRADFLWIGERPIQRISSGLIPPQELGQESDVQFLNSGTLRSPATPVKRGERARDYFVCE
jgi:hypothetical protein